MHLELGSMTICHGTDAWGCEWSATISGLDSGSPTAPSERRTRGNGAWVGSNFHGALYPTLTGLISAPDSPTLESAIDRLKAAAPLEDGLLVTDDGARRLQVAVRRSGQVLITRHTPTLAAWSIQLEAPDPRRVLDLSRTATATLPAVTGGLAVPLVVPVVVAQTVVGGSATLTSTGTIGGPVRLTLVGPLVDPEISHQPSGLTLAVGTTIPEGSALVIDMTDPQRRTVTLDGVSRMAAVTQRGWHAFEPGENRWSLTAAAGSGSLSIEVRDAWI